MPLPIELGEAFIRTTGIVKGVMTAIALMRSAWSLCAIAISWSALCSTGIVSCAGERPAVSSGALRIVCVGIDCAGIVSDVGPRDCDGGVASTGVVALDCNGTVAVAVDSIAVAGSAAADKAKFVGVAAVFVRAQRCTSLAAPSV